MARTGKELFVDGSLSDSDGSVECLGEEKNDAPPELLGTTSMSGNNWMMEHELDRVANKEAKRKRQSRLDRLKVGVKLQMYWPGDKKWCSGKVKRHKKNFPGKHNNKHIYTIKYNDGNIEHYDLDDKAQNWKFKLIDKEEDMIGDKEPPTAKLACSKRVFRSKIITLKTFDGGLRERIPLRESNFTY